MASERRTRGAARPDQVQSADEQVRLITKVARMYHERGLRQSEIADLLHVSQPRVSRLLKRAVELGIVQTSVMAPRGVHAALEEEIEKKYSLREVVVADTGEAERDEAQMPVLAAAAAVYLQTTLTGGDRIGISSWSSTLLAAVEAFRPRPTAVADQVVQLLGGVGVQSAQAHATRLTGGLASLTGATAIYLPAPGLVASATTREALVHDPNIAAVLSMTKDLTLVLVGIGSLEPSSLLRESGNAIAESDQEELRRLGAVGDVCLRFFDAAGLPVASSLADRVIGIGEADLKSVPRRVGVAGGTRKLSAIRAALRGGWVNVLITDQWIAHHLVDSD
jgi:DNA-binding transcriptional regulator LsrR (DeoR family)